MTTRQSASSLLTITHQFTRRECLIHLAAGVTGVALWRSNAEAQQLPPGAGVPATPPCDPSTKPTPSRRPSGFRANAPMRTTLAEPADRGQVLVLSGAVIGLRCGLIAGATVDVWQADAKGMADPSGMRLRGRQRTDAEGRYRLETIVPGAATGEAPRLHVRVTVPGKAVLDTILFLPDAVAGALNKRDASFDPLLAMTLIDRTAARVTAAFNVILDL